MARPAELARLALPAGAGLGALLGKGSFGQVWPLAPAKADAKADAAPPAVPEPAKADPAVAGARPTEGEPAGGGARWAAADGAAGRWVVKVSSFGGSAERRDTFRREVHFLRELRALGVVPLLREWRIEGDRGVQVIERFDGTLRDLGERQAAAGLLPKRALAFTSAQLARVAALARLLDDLGIVHGDAKLSNLLVRAAGTDIRFSDFGFAGTVPVPSSAGRGREEKRAGEEHTAEAGAPAGGFSPLVGFARHFGCDPQREPLPAGAAGFRLRTPYPAAVAARANSGQLYLALARTGRVFLRTRDGAHIPLSRRRLRRALGLSSADLSAMRAFYKRM